jgi:N-acetylmuramoyl-L-alanine amidase
VAVGGDVIRIRSLPVALFLLAPSLLIAATPVPLVLLTEGQRRELLPVLGRGDVELLPIDQVVAGLGVNMVSDASGGAVTLTYQKREVSLYNKKSLASIGGDLRLLSSAVILDEGKWLVPVDSIPRLLQPLLATKSEWRAASRVLIIGNVSVPRVTVSTFVSGDVARVVLEASEKVPFRVFQEEGRVTVSIPRDLVDTPFQQERLAGGVVDAVQFLGGRENMFAVTYGKRFQQMKAFEQETPARLVLEFQGVPQAAARVPPAATPGTVPPSTTPPTSVAPPAAARAPRAAAPDLGVLRTIVIDPGHGGEEVGAQGPGGTLEKDVTLGIARKARAALADNLGLQVFLTRERDVDLSLDDRTAVANNYKADLFVSIHANASRARAANGSEVYFLSYQAGDEEARRLAQLEGAAAATPANPANPAPPGSDLALILWDMAQAEHLEESSTLASRILEELARVTGSEGRGVKQAPFRVLVGAAMPAVLVEVLFISNPEEEKLLSSDAFQSKVAAALTRGIARYQQELSRRASFATGGARAAPQ